MAINFATLNQLKRYILKNHLIHINKEELLSSAKESFISTCGFDLEKTKHIRMMDRALTVLETGQHTIDVNALISEYDGTVYKDSKIVIDGSEFTCDFFSQIPDENVVCVYTYLITANECWFESEEEIMNFLYADSWGTSFVDAASDMIKEFIEKDSRNKYATNPNLKYKLSKSLGPGYYGMPVIATVDMKNIIDFEKLGVTVKDSGLMIPQKSVVGLYMLLNDNSIDFPIECSTCLGNQGGCQYCTRKKKIKK